MRRPWPVSCSTCAARAADPVDFCYRTISKARLRFLPNRKLAKRTISFRRSDLEEQLGRPLSQTLEPRKVLAPGKLTPREQELVNRITGPRFYQYEIRQIPDASAVLVLVPPVL